MTKDQFKHQLTMYINEKSVSYHKLVWRPRIYQLLSIGHSMQGERAPTNTCYLEKECT